MTVIDSQAAFSLHLCLFMIMAVVTVLLGLMLTVFTALNLLSDLGSPFGTFGVKFIYEMDEVMGGQLGIQHYSKLEACMLALGAAGCVSSFLGYQLLPVLGLTSAAGYMYICSLYAFFVGMPIPPFFVVGVVSSLALGYRFRFFLDNPDDVSTAITFLVTMTGLTLLAGVIMAARNTEERKRFNRRFVKISKWCDNNAGFVWLPGKDAPEGFGEADE